METVKAILDIFRRSKSSVTLGLVPWVSERCSSCRLVRGSPPECPNILHWSLGWAGAALEVLVITGLSFFFSSPMAQALLAIKVPDACIT